MYTLHYPKKYSCLCLQIAYDYKLKVLQMDRFPLAHVMTHSIADFFFYKEGTVDRVDHLTEPKYKNFYWIFRISI